jgi:hypothetical protein
VKEFLQSDKKTLQKQNNYGIYCRLAVANGPMTIALAHPTSLRKVLFVSNRNEQDKNNR